MQSRASLLALAASLDAQGDALKAQGDALKAHGASIRAAVESGAQAPALDTITLEAATALLGSKRKAREFIAWCERHGFEVRRIGHAVLMDRAEWERAIAARSSKRAPVSSEPTNSTDDDSPAAIFAAHGLASARPNPNRGTRPKRAA